MNDLFDGMFNEIDRLTKRIEKLEAHSYPEWVYLNTPLTSTSWDGDAFSDVAVATQLDLSSVFGAPAGIKAVLLYVKLRDSAAWGTDALSFACGPSAAQWDAMTCPSFGGDVLQHYLSPVPCDANGDVWYEINASGASTMDITIEIFGYMV